MKMTKASVSAVAMPKGKEEHFEWDDDMPGFGIRLRGDRATWVCGYRIDGRQRRESLGDVRKLSLEAARKVAQNRFAQVKLGIDPAGKRANAKKEATRSKMTFGDAVKKFLIFKEGTVRPSTLGMSRYDLVKLCEPLSKRAVEDIKLIDVAELISEIVKDAGLRSRTRHLQGPERAGRIMGKRARGHLSGFFKWAMGEGLTQSNPVIATNNPGIGVGHRNRVLEDWEMRAIWHAAGDGHAGKIVKLLALSGCRRNEISGLRWSEINMKTGEFILPSDRAKNGYSLVLRLPPMAMDIIKSMSNETGGKEFVFGDGSRPFVNWSYAIAAMHIRIAEGHKIKRWTLHDLRRTLRTGLGKLGVPPHVAERVINHVQPGEEKVYDQYDYDREKTAALRMYADHIADIIKVDPASLPGRGAIEMKLLTKV